MARYRVKMKRKKHALGAETTWFQDVQAETESGARSTAKDLAAFKFPGEIIAVVEVKKI